MHRRIIVGDRDDPVSLAMTAQHQPLPAAQPVPPQFVIQSARIGAGVEARDRFIGRGYYNQRSPIRVRMLTRDRTQAIDTEFFKYLGKGKKK